MTAEAMACGTPVVSTPVGMMRELVEDGRNGILVDFTREGLQRGLERMLGDEEERQRMGREAPAAVQAYEYERVIRRYAEGLLALTQGSTGAATPGPASPTSKQAETSS